MRYFLIFSLGLLISGSLPASAATQTLADRLSGWILLQVQAKGEAWYVDPVSHKRYFLGRPEDAYAVMRSHGLGIKHQELTDYLSHSFPARLSGRILLDVESHGEAYYVVPTTLQGAYLGRPTDAFNTMRAYGLGITDSDLFKIAVGPKPVTTPTASIMAMELRTFNLINEYRKNEGLSELSWSTTTADLARGHSIDMASGTVPFGHDGFSERIDILVKNIRARALAENVAWNSYADPVQTAVNGWLDSEGHRNNIRGDYNKTGIGIATFEKDTYYLTQIFVSSSQQLP